ncbi:MAG TPA: hypothetical protein PKE39_12220 [Ignavibacteria bacterium]|nr:hypothetical protein [Ignavibacteria bacterium]
MLIHNFFKEEPGWRGSEFSDVFDPTPGPSPKGRGEVNLRFSAYLII